MGWWLVAAVLLVAHGSMLMAGAKPDASDVRILFLTDCTPYSDWMSVALVYSYRYSGHKGPITRVMCCSDKDRKRYNPDLLELVETHIAPSVRVSKRTGDNYAAYDKPGAVIDYIHKINPPEDWLLVLDSDMIVRRPVRTEDYNVSLGWAVGSRYNYMIGVSNKLADRHIPEIPRRNDTFAGPAGRRSDMVGGFFLIHKADLKRMSNLWLKYAEDVRADPEAYKYAGDSYAVKPGHKPWISEMYGYSYGAAKANVWHHWDDTTMLYPGYNPLGIPKVLHFGLLWQVQGYSFDKHWYIGFDVRKCAPWDLSTARPLAGLFPHPPRPADLKCNTFGDRYRDLIALEGVATLNAGLCWWHKKRCPPHEQMERECAKAEQIFFEVREALRLAEEVYNCVDTQPLCPKWAASGECTKNEAYMKHNCAPSCKLCTPRPGAEGILGRLGSVKAVRMEAQEVPPPQIFPDELKGQASNPDAPPHGSEATVTRQPAKHHRNEPVIAHHDDQPADQQQHHSHPEPDRHDDRTLHDKQPKHDDQGDLPHEPAKVPHEHADPTAAEHPAVPARKLKSLLQRCHRMGGMTMQEVKACVEAAKQGEAWARKALPPHRPIVQRKLAKGSVDTPSSLKGDQLSSPVRITSSRYVPSQLGSSLLRASFGQMALVLLFFIALLIFSLPRRGRKQRALQQQAAGSALPDTLKTS